MEVERDDDKTHRRVREIDLISLAQQRDGGILVLVAGEAAHCRVLGARENREEKRKIIQGQSCDGSSIASLLPQLQER